MDIILVDSCIIIDITKGIINIRDKIRKIPHPCINFIIEMELLQGAKNKKELIKIKKELNEFYLLPMQNEIAKLSIQLIEQYALSYNLQIPDSIIASTALVFDIPLYTYNIKDFEFIPNLKLYES